MGILKLLFGKANCSLLRPITSNRRVLQAGVGLLIYSPCLLLLAYTIRYILTYFCWVFDLIVHVLLLPSKLICLICHIPYHMCITVRPTPRWNRSRSHRPCRSTCFPIPRACSRYKQNSRNCVPRASTRKYTSKRCKYLNSNDRVQNVFSNKYNFNSYASLSDDNSEDEYYSQYCPRRYRRTL